MLAKAMVCYHELILDTCKTGPTIRERSTFYGQSYRNFDKDSFRKKLSDHKWNDLQNVDKGLVINYGEGGATKWENRGSETFCAPPSRQGKTFRAPPF